MASGKVIPIKETGGLHIETTAGRAWDARGALARLSSEPLGARLAVPLARLVRAVSEAADDVEMERSKLAKSFCAEGQQNVPEEKLGAFSDAWNEVRKGPLTLHVAPLDLSGLPEFKVRALDVIALEGFVLFAE